MFKDINKQLKESEKREKALNKKHIQSQRKLNSIAKEIEDLKTIKSSVLSEHNSF